MVHVGPRGSKSIFGDLGGSGKRWTNSSAKGSQERSLSAPAAASAERWSSSGQRIPAVDRVWAVSRTPWSLCRPWRSGSSNCRQTIAKTGISATLETVLADGVGLSRVVIALGTLHSSAYEPEKSLDALRADVLAEVYRVNCILPLLWVAGLGRALRSSPDTRIAVLSARVGSIGDNGLGGWYAYRSSKAGSEHGAEIRRYRAGSPGPRASNSWLTTPARWIRRCRSRSRKTCPRKSSLRHSLHRRVPRRSALGNMLPDGELSFLAWDGQTDSLVALPVGLKSAAWTLFALVQNPRTVGYDRGLSSGSAGWTWPLHGVSDHERETGRRRLAARSTARSPRKSRPSE
jgi:hypothetical protein